MLIIFKHISSPLIAYLFNEDLICLPLFLNPYEHFSRSIVLFEDLCVPPPPWCFPDFTVTSAHPTNYCACVVLSVPPFIYPGLTSHGRIVHITAFPAGLELLVGNASVWFFFQYSFHSKKCLSSTKEPSIDNTMLKETSGLPGIEAISLTNKGFRGATAWLSFEEQGCAAANSQQEFSPERQQEFSPTKRQGKKQSI